MYLSPLWMLSFAALWVLIAALAIGLALAIRHALRLERQLLDATDGPEVGEAVAPLRLTDLEGRARTLTPGPGRRLAVVFLSPSCSACSQAIRAISALPDIEDTDLLVICQASAETARRYAKREHLYVPVVPDFDGTAARALQVNGVPFGIVVGRDGRVQRKGVPASYRDLLDLVGIEPERTASEPPPQLIAIGETP
jgi:Redoxin